MRSLLVVCVVLAAGCEKPDPAEIVRPLESTLGAAVPAAYFAAVSMAALDGRPGACANVVTPAGNGTVRVDVAIGAGCPPMFGTRENGTMVVTGTWTPQLATFVMDFTGLSDEGHPMLVVGIGSMTIAPSGDHLAIAYGEEDIMVATDGTQGAGVKEVAWAVDVDTLGTDDPSDDTIAVSGGDQSILAQSGAGHADADLTQVAVGNAVFKSGCRRNPNSGIAAVQRAGTRGGGWVLFGFHDRCDGTADVVAAMAPYELLISDSLPLAFLQD